ncbi:MAG: DUF4830 domain-containing protein [Oscillospiraceae bacterium]|nr:DUF4830 domain-containing protein [Oscillospiraceae bacterium]
MFVFSIKSKKFKVFAASVIVLLVAGGIFFVTSANKPASKSDAVNYSAKNSAERLSFISQFGWEADEEPLEVEEVIIPKEFNDTYVKYNEIQKTQGLDLSSYAGVRAKRWTYALKNYDGYPADGKTVRVNLLIYDGRVIGGDVCSVELNGFMHGFASRN